MARVNVGVDVKLLSDQHLIAESVEITMITGGLKMHEYKIKGEIPNQFSLGRGHINFFKNKLVYLYKRLQEVNNEMIRRGFKPGTEIDLSDYPSELCNDWQPTYFDTMLLRYRVVDRLKHPKSGRKAKEFHRYEGKLIGEFLDVFCNNLLTSDVYYV